MFDTYLGTTTGVYRLTNSSLEPLGLESERISAIHARRERGEVTILAGSYGHGMFRSPDGGTSWQPANDGLSASCFRCLSPDPLNPGAPLAGTEPGRIFRTRDGGRSWQELSGLTKIDGHEKWYLPYSPRAGAVRNVFSPAGSTRRLLASVEVGGLLLSDDGGESWRCDPVIDDEDIHHVTGHPSEPDLLFASLGYASLTHRLRNGEEQRFGGVARSRDGGKSWQKLESDYTRATIVPPSRPDLVLAGPALDVSRDGRIVVSSNDGDTWELANDGVESPLSDMVELFVAAPDDTIWAICSGGRLLASAPDPWFWNSALPSNAELRVQSVAFVSSASSAASE